MPIASESNAATTPIAAMSAACSPVSAGSSSLMAATDAGVAAVAPVPIASSARSATASASAPGWLKTYLKLAPRLQTVAHVRAQCTQAFDCLAQCGLRDGLKDWGQFCIDNQLAAALRGDVRKGLFFRGAGSLPFGNQIRSVRELLERLLTPAALAPA